MDNNTALSFQFTNTIYNVSLVVKLYYTKENILLKCCLLRR